MARTYRMKQYRLDWNPHSHAESRGTSVMRVLHRCFGERHSGIRNAPKDYRKMLDRIKKSKANANLRRELQFKDPDPLTPIYKKDANWEYW